MQRLSEASKIPAVRSRTEVIAFLIMTAALVIAPMVAYPVFLMKALCFALFACAFNLLIGYVGLLSFGHALFFGWASYVSAHAAKVWGVTPEIAILSGAAVAALFGAIVGALAIRRQGIYFAMITLALAQMMFFFAVQAPFTHGEDGIQAVPRGRLFGPVAGAFFMVSLENYLTTIGQWVFVVQGVIFVVCVLLFRRGIIGELAQVLRVKL